MLSESLKASTAAPHANPAALLSWKDVEAELIEAVQMSWRLPGRGRWPFAGDAPWHLMTREARADGQFEAWRQEREDDLVREMRNAPRTVPLNSEEVTWMEGRLGWLSFAAETDRKLVEVVLVQKAAGKGRLSWSRIREKMMRSPAWLGIAGSTRGLGMRYSRAVQAVTIAVNRGGLGGTR